ncbi:p21-C-terminal region-binding family protein [Babesia bovis T2Bo]|uniref:Protein BCP1 n=1 Tax=Babesia bovis TaxID=5865 RepID=A7AQR7_BABBO|nr:p21-C-terminal region-binding family protein [Babesia bovis T2Bo]EDO06886.1 p21-C-terminal region-binding family protein [Babesia bovis T2Bo]|eukprot:XP_001610454.1 hypothetical protein [Babesia bovis T2Bo]
MENNNEELQERTSKKQKTDREENEEDSDGSVQAEFFFNDPTEKDRDGILTIIQGCLKKVPWEPPSGSNDSTYGILATLITEQSNLGTVVKSDDKDDPYVLSVLSILNLKQYQQLESLGQSFIAMAKQVGSENDIQTMQKLITGERSQIGFLINERMGNIPIQLIGNLHKCVYDDLQWSLENTIDDNERKYYHFTHLMGIARVYTENPTMMTKENTVYVKPEERFYCEESILDLVWHTGESNKVDFYGKDNNTKPIKSKVIPEAMVLYCLPIKKFKFVVQKIAKTFVDV